MHQALTDHYHSRGWVVVSDVFRPDEAERIAEVALDVSRSEETGNDEARTYRFDVFEDGSTAPRKIDRPFFKHPEFRAFVLDTRIRGLLTDLLESEPLLKGDQIFMKPPRFGSAKPYHQDNYYYQCHPGGHVITAWIALEDVDEDNGCLRYINGSHRLGIIPHVAVPGQPYDLTPSPEKVDLSEEMPAPVPKGGVVFHHSEVRTRRTVIVQINGAVPMPRTG